MSVEWETKYGDLLGRATGILEDYNTHLKEDIEILRPLIVRDVVVKAGWCSCEGDGARLVTLILKSLEEGWLKPPVTAATVWRLASRFGRVPDWPPYEEGEPL
jgi:hypothetical protein